MATASDNITLNLGSGGPVVHTDFITGTGHVQYVKLDIGAANSTTPVTTSNPLPVNIYGFPTNWTTLPVGGGTNGQDINVGTVSVGNVGISSGSTIDQIVKGVSTDIRTVAAGISFHVTNFGGSLGVTVDAININSIPVPASITTGIMNVDGVSGGTLPGFSCESGLKIKNLLKSTSISGGALLAVGFTGAATDGSNFVEGTTADKFILYPGEEMFIEVTDLHKINTTAVALNNDTNAIATFTAS